MSGAITPLPQYTFIAWLVKAQGQLYLYLYLYQLRPLPWVQKHQGTDKTKGILSRLEKCTQ
jgi:hypothetical protein